MKHIAIFDDMADVQTALNEEVLVKPYVALVDGALDYNTLDVQNWIVEWDTESAYPYICNVHPDDECWDHTGLVEIGTLNGVYYQGAQMDMNVLLFKDLDTWQIEITYEEASEHPTYVFEEGTEYEWICESVETSTDSSDASLKVSWDGAGHFEFCSVDTDYPLDMLPANIACESES